MKTIEREIRETIDDLADWGDPEGCHGAEDEMMEGFIRFCAAESRDEYVAGLAQIIVDHLDRTAGETRWFA